jgi:D-glycerate 3-kinase
MQRLQGRQRLHGGPPALSSRGPGSPEHLALATWIAGQARPGRALVVGINGAQGCGKSTLAARLQHLLEHALGRSTAVLSLDDFYLTRAQRAALARTVHPLLATRGVPGTHDVALAQRTLARLRELRQGESLRLPRFVKARDERAPEGDWPACSGPLDVVLFEGWCVGTPPQADDELAAPVNTLESDEDPEGRWRAYVNAQLATVYAPLFSMLDRLVFLRAPGFEVVHAWRLEQEAGNAAAAPGAAHVMTSSALERFIAHYERLTRHALRVLPARADAVLGLDAQRRVTAARLA